MFQNISTDPKVVMENSEAQGKLVKIAKNIEEDDSSDFSEKDPRSPGRPKKRYDIPPQDLFVFLRTMFLSEIVKMVSKTIFK